MPSIEISAEQAQALADGEDIVIRPAVSRISRYIIVFDNGNVFDCTTRDDVPLKYGEHCVTGECKLIAKGPHGNTIGFVQGSVAGRGRAVQVPV